MDNYIHFFPDNEIKYGLIIKFIYTNNLILTVHKLDAAVIFSVG